MAPPKQLSADDALLIVDVQNDFCPGGTLPVQECRAMIDVLNQWIDAARRGGSRIVASRDWHSENHVSFREFGGPWPAHCIQGSEGARFCKELHLPEHVEIVSKGSDPHTDNYSAFAGTGLAERLQEWGIRRVWIGGVALDVCVRSSVLDALNHGFETHVILDGTRAVDEESGRRVIEEIRSAGAIID